MCSVVADEPAQHSDSFTDVIVSAKCSLVSFCGTDENLTVDRGRFYLFLALAIVTVPTFVKMFLT